MIDDDSKGRHAKAVLHRSTSLLAENGESWGLQSPSARPGSYNYTTPDYLRYVASGVMSNIPQLDGWTISPVPLAPPNWSIEPVPVDERLLINDVIQKARGIEADVPLNIIEGNQIVPSVKSLANCLPEMKANWRDIRKVLGTASGSFLAWKFGVSPLLSDFGKIHDFIPKFTKACEDHQKAAVQRFSRNVTCSSSFGKNDVTSSLNGRVVYKIHFKGDKVIAPIVRYVLVIRPRVKYLTPLFNAASVIASKFATSPADLAWEKIPFSFVLDWFVDMRGLLRSVDNFLGVHSPYEVVSFTRSFSYNLKTTAEFTLSSPCDGTKWADDPDAASVSYKHYERTPVTDVPTGPFWSPHFGKSQAAVTAALITQKLVKVL